VAQRYPSNSGTTLEEARGGGREHLCRRTRAAQRQARTPDQASRLAQASHVVYFRLVQQNWLSRRTETANLRPDPMGGSAPKRGPGRTGKPGDIRPDDPGRSRRQDAAGQSHRPNRLDGNRLDGSNSCCWRADELTWRLGYRSGANGALVPSPCHVRRGRFLCIAVVVHRAIAHARGGERDQTSRSDGADASLRARAGRARRLSCGAR